MYFHIFNRWRFFDNLTTLLSVLGLVLTMVCYEAILLKYHPVELNINNRLSPLTGETAMETRRFRDPLNIKIRNIVLFLSIGSCVTMIMRHYFKVLW